MEARQAAIWKINRMEEVVWRQKSRMLWLKEGDKNTKFFHNAVKARRRVNQIGRLRMDDRFFEQPEDINEEDAIFFENLFKWENVPWPTLEGIIFPSISKEARRWAERDFEDEEVERVLVECDNDKAPSSNSFNFYFIKAGRDFHSRCRLSKHAGASHHSHS